MRVHPTPRKRSIIATAAASEVAGRQRKLRRLPHLFSKVLELPLGADAEVAVEEDAAGIRFVAAPAYGLWGEGDVRAHVVEIYPGAMKIVIRDEGDEEDEEELELALELDRWRFRLPPSALPALATAAYLNGELVVIVPKGPELEEEDREGRDDNGGLRGGNLGHFVVVQ